MKNAHRITNLCYPRGAVVYAKFSKYSEYYYLNMRPLIVVSNQMQMFDSLTVIGCGSKDRPGIIISLFNHYVGKWIGDHEYSIAQPYSIFSINTNQIQEFHGVVDTWTMKAIDKSMAFHLGLTDEVPEYLNDVWEELLKPKYRMGTEDNTQLDDPHQYGSTNETTRKFERIPSVRKTAKSAGDKVHISNYTLNEISQSNDTTEENKEYNLDNTIKIIDENHNALLDEIVQTKEEANTTEHTPVNNIRQGTAELIIPKPIDTTIKPEIAELLKLITEDDEIACITRKMVSGKYGARKTINISSQQIPPLRRAIEIKYNLLNGKFSSSIANRICHQQRNFRFLNSFEKVASILYCTPDDLQISNAIYCEVAKVIIKEYKLEFTDKRSWRGLENFNRLKGIKK